MVVNIQGDIVKLKQNLDVIKADIAKAKESNHGILSNKQK